MIQVSVHGAEGRMGGLVSELVAGADDLELAALISEPGRDRLGSEEGLTIDRLGVIDVGNPAKTAKKEDGVGIGGDLSHDFGGDAAICKLGSKQWCNAALIIRDEHLLRRA